MGAITRTITIVAMIAIFIFFLCIGRKASTASSPDVRRRLKILQAGSTIANTPLFILVLISVSTGKDLGDGIPSLDFSRRHLYLHLSSRFLWHMWWSCIARWTCASCCARCARYALARSSLWFLRALTVLLLGLAIMHALHHNPVRLVDAVQVAGLAALLLVVRFRTTKLLSSWIDRKFFREAYSAEQVLGELATQAQGFTETPALIHTVSDCIANALHVDRIAVLLRHGDTFRLQYAHGVDIGSDLLLSGSSKTITNLDLVKSPASVYLDNPDAWLLAATNSGSGPRCMISAPRC